MKTRKPLSLCKHGWTSVNIANFSQNGTEILKISVKSFLPFITRFPRIDLLYFDRIRERVASV
jgi:hypothetical protein